MVIYFLNSAAAQQTKERFLYILSSKTMDPQAIEEAINILKEHGTFDMAKRKMVELIDSSWKEAETHLPNNAYRQVLKELAEFCIRRDH
jgi:geranylgeranyl pyrophosphate synthase